MAKKDKKKAKPAAKKVAKKAKPVAKKTAKPAKKAAKPAKKAAKPAKVKAVKPVKAEKVKKGKPIDAIAKKGKGGKAEKIKGKKGKKGKNDDDDDVEVKDDYEKPEDEDALVGELDEAGIVDLEGTSAPEPEEDEDEVPEKRGRGRRRKNEGKSSGSSMEAYIRNRPLQIDISKPLIKKSNVGSPKPFINTKDNRSRYTDKELTEFKELILEKLLEAQTDYELLKQTLSNEDNHGTDDTSPSFKLLEDGSDVMSKEETAQLASRQEKYIINLKNALVRIENKTYGICRVTGKLIPKERLRSVPHATLGIDAKLSQ
jgi:DnaK suppressor protein